MTKQQERVLEWVARYTVKESMPPTQREIAEAFGMSPNGPRCHLVALERVGLVRIRPKVSRGIVVTPEGYKALNKARPAHTDGKSWAFDD